jgi:hypothetical protein
MHGRFAFVMAVTNILKEQFDLFAGNDVTDVWALPKG